MNLVSDQYSTTSSKIGGMLILIGFCVPCDKTWISWQLYYVLLQK